MQQREHRCKAEHRTLKAKTREKVSDQEYLTSKVKPHKDQVSTHSHALVPGKPLGFQHHFGCQETPGRSDIKVPVAQQGKTLNETYFKK